MATLICEYIWLDSNNNFRSKTKIINIEMDKQYQFPKWNYDGSSTGQAEGSDSEILLIPVFTCRNPFRQNELSFLVWCQTYNMNNEPLINSTRNKAKLIFDQFNDEEPWFGLEQEYFIMDPVKEVPLEFTNNNPHKQGKYYCGIDGFKQIEREIVDKHVDYCIYAGLKICGTNAEVAPSQWEYQIGPCVGIEAGDHLWMSRYILNRIAELYGLNISYHPKPLGKETDWNGSGCHTNFSTKAMRESLGLTIIEQAIKRLSNNHTNHMEHYGEFNRERMSGKHETSSYEKFTFGRANRGASVRIPNETIKNNCGYFEDRRPGANCDPYLVSSLILETSMNPKYD